MFGKIESFLVENNTVEIIFAEKKGFIEIINDNTIRVFDEKALLYSSFSNIKENSYIPFSVTQNDIIEIHFGNKRITIKDNFKVDFYNDNKLILADYLGEIKKEKKDNNHDILKLEGHKVLDNETLSFKIVKKLNNEAFYGLGDKTGFLNKRGYEYINWNTDDPAPHVDCFKSLYKSIPFFIGYSDTAYGIFLDNTYKSVFNMGEESNDYFYFGAVDGAMNYYFFFGPKIKDVVCAYTKLTGRTPLPQLWTLGYHQSRWSYANIEQVNYIANNFIKHELPIDCIHLDIDYMKEYAVFTVDENKFPNFKKIIADLKEKGIKVVTIIDPGVKIKKDYFVYEEGIKNNYFATYNNEVYQNAVWPGDSVFPNFLKDNVRNWWGGLTKNLTDMGVAGIWNDMNEPASFKGPLPLDVEFNDGSKTHYHKEIHNIYGHLMAKATFDGMKENTKKRPFIITRAAFSGTQKYSTIWTGDNHSIWSHITLSLVQMLNLGMSGMIFAGSDIGGFGSNATKELLARFIQLGAFEPLCRNHSSIGTRSQEPWAFDEELLSIYAKFLKIRYKLIPYYYDLFYEHSLNGLPILRPLIMEYNDQELINKYDEFLIGENLLIAPVLHEGDLKKLVYLPKGKWIDYFTNEVYEGEQYIIMDAPLDTCVMFVKYNSIIPNYKPILHIELQDEIILNCYGDEGVYTHYYDDGESFDYENGKYSLFSFSFDAKGLKVEILNNGFKAYKKITVNYKNKTYEKDFGDVSFE